MTGLHKDRTARLAERRVLAHVRASYPRPFRVRAVLVREHAAHDEYLFAAVVPMGAEAGLRRPSHQGRSGTLAHQRHHAETGHHALMPGCSAGIDDLAHCLVGAEMPQFDEQRAADGAERRMRRPRWIHEV